MVDYQLCHPFLHTVLPKLCQLIHDKVERVRLAVVDLLLKVKSLHAFKVQFLRLSSSRSSSQSSGRRFVSAWRTHGHWIIKHYVPLMQCDTCLSGVTASFLVMSSISINFIEILICDLRNCKKSIWPVTSQLQRSLQLATHCETLSGV